MKKKISQKRPILMFQAVERRDRGLLGGSRVRLISQKRPILMFQAGRRRDRGLLWGPRLRLFYPDGHVEWLSVDSSAELFAFNKPPCWIKDTSPKNMKEAMQLAMHFDKEHGWPPMLFVEEL